MFISQEDTQESLSQVILCNVLMHLEMLIASRVYEKDVFMSVNHCMDLKQRLGSAEINLPQVFVHGHLLGVRLDADDVFRN